MKNLANVQFEKWAVTANVNALMNLFTVLTGLDRDEKFMRKEAVQNRLKCELYLK